MMNCSWDIPFCFVHVGLFSGSHWRAPAVSLATFYHIANGIKTGRFLALNGKLSSSRQIGHGLLDFILNCFSCGIFTVLYMQLDRLTRVGGSPTTTKTTFRIIKSASAASVWVLLCVHRNCLGSDFP